MFLLTNYLSNAATGSTIRVLTSSVAPFAKTSLSFVGRAAGFLHENTVKATSFVGWTFFAGRLKNLSTDDIAFTGIRCGLLRAQRRTSVQNPAAAQCGNFVFPGALSLLARKMNESGETRERCRWIAYSVWQPRRRPTYRRRIL